MAVFLNMVAWLFKALPRKVSLKAGSFLGLFLGAVSVRRKRVCLKNLDIAFGGSLTEKEKKSIIRRMYSNLGKNLADFLRITLLTKENLSSIITCEGEENMEEARRQGKGVLVITAHYGFWDAIAVYFSMKGLGSHLITKEIRNRPLNEFWMKYRMFGGVKPIFKKNSSKEIISILRKNESIGFVLDQNMNERSGVFVDFFGVRACTLDVVAKLAHSFGSPAVPVFCVRNEDDTLTIKVGKPVPVAVRETKEETIRETTQQYTKILEGYVRERPDHWIWMHKRWKTRPAGEQKIYT